MAATQTFVLPGEPLPTSLLPLPSNPSHPLKLGPGLQHRPPSTITSTVAGPLCIEPKKNAIWVENASGRYTPQANDLVIATVHHSSAESFLCTLTPYTAAAQLPHLAFENVSKKTRPQLPHGALVYARVSNASKHLDPELTCVSPSTGKSDGLGELKGGMAFDISLGMARRLLMAKQREEGGVGVLEDVAERVAFEVAVGRNGRVWVHSGSVRETLLVGRVVQATDREGLNLEEQKKLVGRLLKDL